jgi:hypothetical protein
MHNLKVASGKDYISGRNIGIICSIVVAYQRAKAAEIRKAKQKAENDKSEYVGSIGDRIEITVKEFSIVTSWDNCFDRMNVTTTYLYTIIDNNDNIFTWKTSKRIDCVASLKGTVKAHTEFRGTKQTELTRCKVEHIKGTWDDSVLDVLFTA